ncbi:MAG: hypothetical protein GY813_15505, partial [Halieaceae bacterium]|nr:hypothetical protein [Halieaceae bacterium]
MSKAEVLQLMEDQNKAAADTAKQLTEQRDANVKLFTEAINANDGFSDDLKKQLCEAQDLITADMAPEQVKALSDNQINMGNQISAAARLAGQGFQVPGAAGSVHIGVDDSNAVKSLQETMDRRLGILDLSDAKRFESTGGKLLEENKKFADKVLRQFDAEHAPALREEHKMLSGGDGVVSDVVVPVSWERTVIREALYRLVGLQFVDVNSVTFGSSYSIPYSYRDTTAAGRNSTRKYEGQSIQRAGVIQTAETAYNLPQKISFEVSDELRYLTQAGHINYEAVAENQRNASRIIGEDTEQVIFNEVLRSADEFGAVPVASENLELQADGSDTILILANFPV